MLFGIFDKNKMLNTYIGSVGAEHYQFRKDSVFTKPKLQV